MTTGLHATMYFHAGTLELYQNEIVKIPAVKLLRHGAPVTEGLISSAETQAVIAWDDPALLPVCVLDCTLCFV